MPYIKQSSRKKLEGGIDVLVDGLLLQGPGEFNYAITEILIQGIELTTNPSYAKLNEALGILEAVKLELYRRVAAPYEDQKIKENGDAY